MPARPLDLLDFPALYRLRDQALCLDSVRLLTHGNPLEGRNLVSALHPARRTFSAVHESESETVFGGVSQAAGQHFARLLYLTPQERIVIPGAGPLLEVLTTEAGQWGAWHVTAEVEENAPAFEALRQAGFALYAWQRFWQINSSDRQTSAVQWRAAKPTETLDAQNIFHQLVPPLLQSIEMAPQNGRSLLICCQPGRGYALRKDGPQGIVVFPMLHPEVQRPEEALNQLAQSLVNPRGLPVYFCVRSYQAWLEMPLQALGAQPGPQQAALAKRLTLPLKEGTALRAAQSGTIIPASNLSSKP